jgi:hypothetical protein
MYMGVNEVLWFIIGDPFGWRELLHGDLEVNTLFTMGLVSPFCYWAPLFIAALNL